MMTTYRHIWVVASVAYIHEDRNLSKCDTRHLLYTDHTACLCNIWVRASVVYNHQDRYRSHCHTHHFHYTGHRFYSRCHRSEEDILYEFEGSLWWKSKYWRVLSSFISHRNKNVSYVSKYSNINKINWRISSSILHCSWKSMHVNLIQRKYNWIC